ncbi:MAG: class I SAM-dependent methyltransferase [Acidobacteriia bacterium]|nr:class I SAM-dependent methyltransferase [Terriglobia bacterium]
MDAKGDELAAMIAEIRQRVRSRNPNGAVVPDAPIADLLPLMHARDAAEGKVASIGTVNPRAPGFVNSVVQRVKRLAARALDWHVREQVEFNRAVIACVQSTLEALNECNRNITAVSARISGVSGEMQQCLAEAQQLKDIRVHWSEWRVAWEKKLAETEIQFLRSVAELQSSFQHRVTLMDAHYREQVKAQHADFEGALARTAEETQHRFWMELDRVRGQYETLIHSELRLLRQKVSFARTVVQVAESAPAEFAHIDWLKFADRFRGSESDIRQRQSMYAARFRDHSPVLDIGCGRGEMLDVFREAGVRAHGIDLNDDSVAICLSRGLDAEKADLFGYLNALADSSLGGAVCCQVVEHLPPERLPEMIRLLHRKLRPGALVAIETPNPECLAIFATHFYLDPTHRHPIPPALLSFYLEEAGFGRIEIERLSPAADSMPSIAELPPAFRQEFFGSLDFAAFAIKLG